MFRTRRLQVALILSLIAGLLGPALLIQARAASYDWVYTYNYDNQQGVSFFHVAEGYLGYWTPSGMHSNDTPYTWDCCLWDGVNVGLEWTTPVYVDHVEIDYQFLVTGNQQTIQVYDSGGILLTNTWLTSSEQGVSYTFSQSVAKQDQHHIQVSMSAESSYSGNYTGNGRVLISEIRIYGQGNQLYPTYTPTPTSTPTNTPTPTPVPTQPPAGTCLSSWTKTYQFADSGAGWSTETGTMAARDEAGYHTIPNQSQYGWTQSLDIWTNIGSETEADTTVSAIGLNIDYNQGDPGLQDLRKIQVVHNDTDVLVDLTRPSSGTINQTWSVTSTGGKYEIIIYASGAMLNESQANGSATVISMTITAAGVSPDGSCIPGGPTPSDAAHWAYPVASGDRQAKNPINGLSEDGRPDSLIPGWGNRYTNRSPFTYLTSDIPYATYDKDKEGVLFYGNDLDRNVHSMTEGEVSSVTRLSTLGDVCRNVNPNQVLSPLPGYSCYFDIPGAKGNALDYHDASLVVVTTDTALISYLVANVQVQEGETVSPGCILGQTLPFQEAIFNVYLGWPPSIGYTWTPTADSYTVVQARDLSGIPFDLVPNLMDEPQDLRCGGGGGAGAGGCAYVHDPYFFFSSSDNPWQAMGSGTNHAAGLSSGLWLRDTTTQGLNLDATHSYTITVTAHLLTSASGAPQRVLGDFDALPESRAAAQTSLYDFTVKLGANTATTISLTTQNSETTTIGPDTFLPLDGSGFLLAIAPTSHTQDNVVVDYICVSDTDSGNPAPSGGCLLLNPEFETQDAWTRTNGGGGQPLINKGLVTVPDGSSIAQDLELFPKNSGAQNYTLTVSAYRQGVPATGQSVSFDWSYTSHNGSVGPFTDNTLRDGTDTFSITTHSTGTLTITTNASSGTQVGVIDKVCVTTDDGTDPPGYQAPPPPSVTAQCKTCAYVPVGDVNYDLPGVIAWLMCGIAQIWTCQMRQILYGIWQVVTSILTFLVLSRAWIALTLNQLAAWVNADIRIFTAWLNGALANLMTAITGVIAPWGPHDNGGGANIWDVLIAFFNVLRDLIKAIVTLATALFELLGALVGLIINGILYLITQLIGLLRTLINLILNALNAPPIPPEGVPVCDDTAEVIYENCVPIFMINNTILGDTSPLWRLLPLIEGASGFGLIWWAIGKIRNALTRGGENS